MDDENHEEDDFTIARQRTLLKSQFTFSFKLFPNDWASLDIHLSGKFQIDKRDALSK